MECERGDVIVSHTETLVESMDCDNRVEESFEEEEIMVEVVGSDVLVDGVSGDKECNFESGEEPGTENLSEDMGISMEEDGNKIGGSGLGLSESDDQRNDADEGVDARFSESAGVEGGTVSALPSSGIGVPENEIWRPGIEAMTVSSVVMDTVTVQSEVVTVTTHVVVSEETAIRNEAVDKEFSPHLEDDVDGKVDVPEKEEAVPSNDIAANDDHSSADAVVSCGLANEADDGQIVPSKDDGVDRVEGEVGQDNANVGGETSTPNIDGGGVVDANSIGEKEVSLESEALVSNVQDDDQGNLKELHDVKVEANNQMDGVSHATPEPVLVDSLVSERGKIIGEKDVSLESDALVSNVQDDNQGNIKELHDGKFEATQEPIPVDSLVSEREETIGMDFDVVLDFKEGECGSDLPDISVVGSDEFLKKTDGDVETNTVHQNRAFSEEPNRTADEGDAAELNEDKEAYTEENKQNTTSLSCPRDEEMVEAVREVVDDRKAVEEDTEQRKEIDSEISKQSLENKDVSTKAETADVGMTDDVAYDNPLLNSEFGLENVAEESGLPHNTEQENSVQITDMSNDGVDKVETNINGDDNEEGHASETLNVDNLLESADVMPNEVANIGIAPEEIGKEELHVSTSNITEENSMCDVAISSDNLSKADGIFIEDGHITETKLMDIDEETEFDMTHHDNNGTEEPAPDNDRPEETVKSMSSLKMNQLEYLSPPENEGGFAISDLVWGKVRSHPWWPGQIFDPSDASEKALKYHKKDAYLVAYFGDRTFAWNDASVLKPFRTHFSQIQKQSNSEAFQNSVDCALEEVSRRVELGLACSCIPKDTYSKIETQVVENAGICEESSQRHGLDQSSRAASFEPDKLLQYITNLAPHTSSGADRLDLVIAQSQLTAFCRFKGYRLPSGFPSSGELLENDVQISESHKRKHSPASRKERSVSELIVDGEYSPDAESARKRRAVEPLANGSDRRGVSTTPKPSFKIGECIRKVASQLVKGSTEEAVTTSGSPKIYENSESLSVNDMLSQLQVTALNPKKVKNFQKNISTFFLGFRSSIALNKRGRKRKAETTVNGSGGEEFEFDDVNDSYWTDRIVQNYSENGDVSTQIVPYSVEKTVKQSRKPNSRKRYSTGSYPVETTEVDESVKRKKLESSPAELILNFAERKSVPSEINLNKTFRRFGPLMESETEVDHESGRAKVIFKRGSDAEVARNSSEKFKIFGTVLVNYEIGYTPLISVKILPLALPGVESLPPALPGPEDTMPMV